MSQAIAAKYAHEEAGESERPLRVCAEAGRKCVRNIQQYPILSSEWISLVDSLKQLSRLVQLESRMPANTKVSEAAGRNTDSDGTLWDQEAHENAVRILVEEAKVNLCLRMMTDYKKWQYSPSERQRTMQEAAHAYELTESQLDQKCRSFEESLGVLLMKAFQHKETLQLMDIPMLIEHCCLVFQSSFSVPGSVEKTQEFLVPHYFSSLMKHAEELNNSELIAKAKDTNLIFYAARHMCGETYAFDMETLGVAAEGFAALADNEDFRTVWITFFRDESGRIDEERKKLFTVSIQQRVVDPVLKANPEKTRILRPLTDLIKQIERA